VQEDNSRRSRMLCIRVGRCNLFQSGVEPCLQGNTVQRGKTVAGDHSDLICSNTSPHFACRMKWS
jgi:hypothetical protein